MPCAGQTAKLAKYRVAASEAQHQIEVAQAIGADIRNGLTGLQLCQRDRGIEIIEDAQRARAIRKQPACGLSIGAVGTDDNRIGVDCIAAGLMPDVVPVTIEFETAARQFMEIPRAGVIGDVAFEENDIVTKPNQVLA